LCLALNGKAGKCIHDISIGIVAEASDKMEFPRSVMGGKPYPLRPFSGAGINPVKRRNDLMAEHLIISGKHV
jgi:hypothetical protein